MVITNRRDKLSIYIPQEQVRSRPVERLISLSCKRGKSANSLAVQAILEYLRREKIVERLQISGDFLPTSQLEEQYRELHDREAGSDHFQDLLLDLGEVWGLRN